MRSLSRLSILDLFTEDDGGTLRVTAVKFNPNVPINLTYNLDVTDFHTYFVGEDGVLVHNGWGKDLAVGLGLLYNFDAGEIRYSPDNDDRMRKRVELSTGCGSNSGASPPKGGLNEYNQWIVSVTGLKYK